MDQTNGGGGGGGWTLHDDGMEGWWWRYERRSEEQQGPTHSFFVPGLVGGCPTQDVVDDVVYQKADEEEGANRSPHDFPVQVGRVSQHVLDILFKPTMSVNNWIDGFLRYRRALSHHGNAHTHTS